MAKYKNITGKFNSWTIVEPAGYKDGNARSICRCECGVVRTVLTRTVVTGESKSCGCRVIRHGARVGSVNPCEYLIWVSMRQRCSNPKASHFACYGGRGITVCERWQDYKAFISDMGPRPSSGHSLDRIDNSLGYSPSNCKWSTRLEQCRNKRNVRFLTAHGVTRSLPEWADLLGIHRTTLSSRISRGWAHERALQMLQQKEE